MKQFDCAVIGAGAAGLAASLVLGRSRRTVAVFDNRTNRNRLTQESHGFLTRDGIKPGEFKAIGLMEIKQYPSVHFFEKTVTSITKQQDSSFFITTSEQEAYIAEKVLLATGIQEELPLVPSIQEYYGKSLFNCPYCDGWERRDQPLLVIAENEEHALHMGRLLYNWSENLLISTNGHELSAPVQGQFKQKGIAFKTEIIHQLHGEDGYLKEVEFASGEKIKRTGGFVVPSFQRAHPFAELLECEMNEQGAVLQDGTGRTTQKNVYTAGEAAQGSPSSLLIAAADGSKAATAVNFDLSQERF